MTRRRFFRRVKIIPNPCGRYRHGKLLLLGLAGNNFRGGRGVANTGQSGESIAKLLGRETANCRAVENKLALGLFAKVHRRQLVSP